MHDSISNLLPPSNGDFPPTPSGLTPNTRSEAEAALAHNTLAQTDSAAPTTPLAHALDGMDEAKISYGRPRGPVRTSSDNYEKALKEAHKQEFLTSTLTEEPTAMEVLFPAPGQGVVPLHTGVGTGQAEAIKKAKPTGLSLGGLMRTPSWNEQDARHIYSATLLAKVTEGDAGYDSEAPAKEASGN